MKVYELKLKAYLMEDISAVKSSETIAALIDKSFIHSEEMKKFHKERKFKFYTFNSFYPLEKDKIYKAGKIYTVLIRTVDDRLVKYFETYLANEYTDKIKALTVQTKVLPYRHIHKIYSVTPCVVKFDGYWKGKYTISEYENRLRTNLIKKYQEFFGEKLDENFELFNHIQFENDKPIAIPIKNIKLLGDKLSLQVADNKTAQMLSYFALGTGLSELNSRGYGYTNYKFI
ncbi:CRISPR-associated endoribonuclease Cas6 [Sedimentibacter sp. MB31-C6]|uniref:CRISPR-associated endoribonuclease Cas6 n=1 Tax=Sedimentibacter sp. MB31-C6 TaxID=3109366 RepID=UPI002DDD1549|nr:CRISPR-associated endoribonuclease Cas6 [Sedimentibacter sp. MB36-C1]WSI05059.1 CRISPR-associated endoribonuclease Cas6 [Sedimentibacter sp. MB36-C1]